MAEDGISTKVSVLGDKEYKAALADIGRQLTVLNTNMAATQSAFDGQADAMEALKSKSASLQAIYEAQAKKVQLVAEQLNKAKQDYGENSKQADNLRIALNRAQTAMNKTGSEIRDTGRQLDEMTAALQDNAAASDDAADGANDAADGIREEGDASDEAKDKNRALGDAMDKAGEIAGGALKAGLKAAAAAIAALATAAAAGGKELLKLGDDYQQAAGQLAAQTGAAGQELEELGGIAQQVYRDNFGESLTEVASSMATVKTNTGLMGEELKAATENGYALRDTFGMEFSESSRAANALMKRFGLSADEAYNLIAVGAQKGANQNGDLLDVISEYAPKYAEMGLSADQMMQTFINGAAQGVFQIDKVGDAVKEFSIRAIDGSDSTKEAFKSIGLNATYMAAEIAEGGPVAENAFREVVTALMAVEDPIKRNTAAVALFGTQYEDLGQAALPILAGITDTSDTTADALSQINEVKYNNLSDALGGVKRQIEGEFLPLAKTMTDSATQTLNDISAALSDGFQPEDIKTIGESVATALMNGIGSIGTMISENKETFDEAVKQIVDIMGQALPGLISVLSEPAMTLLQSVLDAVVENAEAIGNMAADLIAKIASFLAENAPGLVDAAGDIIGGLLDGLLADDTLAKLVPAAIEMIAKLGASLVENAGKLLEKAPEIIGQLITGLENTNWLEIGTNLIQGLVNGLTSAATSLMESIKNVFVGIWNAIKGVFGINSPSTVAKEAGGYILDGLIAGFESAVSAACDAVKRIFGKIWDAIKSIFGFGGESDESKEAKEAGKDIMGGIKEGITGSESDLENAVKTAAGKALNKFKTEFGVSDGNSTKTKAYGEKLAKGIDDGLSGVSADTFSDGAENVANAIDGAMDSKLKVKYGGSMLFYPVGAKIAQGIAWGLKDNAGDADNIDTIRGAIAGVANAAYEAAVSDISGGLTGSSGTVNAAVSVVCDGALAAAAAILTADAGTTLGSDWAGGIQSGISGRRAKLVSEVAQTLRVAASAARTQFSASVGRPIGRAFAQGVQGGLQAGAPSVTGAAAVLGSGALSALWGAIGSGGSRFDAIGLAIASGIARGIRRGQWLVKDAAQNTAQLAYDAAKATLKIASPSRAMAEIGEYYDQGFAQGIDRGMARVLASARALSAMAAEETRGGARFGSVQQTQIDYDRLGDAVADSLERRGVGRAVVQMDGRIVGETVEPSVSIATQRRASRSISGRAARMVLV